MNNYYTLQPTHELLGKNYGLWQPDGLINQKIQVDSSVSSNWKYRQYMQKNANDIMKYNTMQAINTSGNNPYTILNNEPTNNTPYLYSSLHDTSNPSVGTRTSDLKQDFLNKQQMKARMISPSIQTLF
jgi:hypothetical protein